MKKLLPYLALLTLVVTLCIGLGQKSLAIMPANNTIPFDADRWNISLAPGGESRFESYLGQDSLYLRGGFATLKGETFQEGTLEYDVAFSNSRGFVGAIFRAVDLENHERFFMRPQQSGSIDSVQYTPVFHDIQSWKLYYGEGFNGSYTFNFDQWMHVKLAIAGESAEVYVDDMTTPLYVIPYLKRPVADGMLGVFALNPERVAGHFSNFSYSTTKPTLTFVEQTLDLLDAAPSGLITTWEMSSLIPEMSLDSLTELDDFDQSNLTTTIIETDESGVANISAYVTPTPEANTVLLQVNLNADRPQLQALEFGYSDFVKVYFNGKILYQGDNSFQSRNELHLGTIGFYETLYLPLKVGNNKLSVALSASPQGTAGWGMVARLDNSQDLEISPGVL